MATQSEKISVLTATIVGMNAMIGAGVLAIPSTFATKVGPAGIISFFLVAVSVWCIAQSLARVAQLNPQEGSFYTYASSWGGHYVGVIANLCYIIGLFIAMGLLMHGAGDYLAIIFPCFSVYTWSLITLISIVTLNMVGIALSSLGQHILIALTVFPLLATIGLCLPKISLANLTPFVPHGVKSIFTNMSAAAFCFFGFESSASLFSIIKDPAKNLPRSLTYSVIAVAMLYLLFITTLILAVPSRLFEQYPGPISDPLAHLFPESRWIIICILISCVSAILGTLHSMIWSSGTLVISFTKKLHHTSAQKLLAFNIINHHTVYIPIGLAIFTSFSILKGNESYFLFTALFLLTAFILSIIGLLKIKSEWASKQNYITIAGISAACMIGYFALEKMITIFL